MSPKLLLALWKERWGKPSITELQVPYIQGGVSHWAGRLAQNLTFSLPIKVVASVLFGCLMLAVCLPSQLTAHDQFVFSVLLLLIAFYVRLHAGIFITLFLVGLSFIASSRYLFWRFSSTLGHEFDLAFIYGFILCAAEAYLCVQVVLELIETRWPLKRTVSLLRNDQNQWPTIDVFLVCAGHSSLNVESAMTAVKSLDWPQRKIKFFLLDDEERIIIKIIAESFGASYLKLENSHEGKVGNINSALDEAKGELIVILECDQATDKAILQMTSGWFMRDAKLGLLITPHHFLVPKPSKRNLKLFDSRHLDQSFAMIRRSMLVKIGRSELVRLPVEPLEFVIQMKTLGYDSAYIGFPRNKEMQADEPQAVALGGLTSPDFPIFRVNRPFSNDTPLLGLRIGVSSLDSALRFYELLPRFAFLLAPLPFLIGGTNIIQTSMDVFAVYVAPHLLLWYIAKARLHDIRRLKVWDEIRQTWLGCDLLVRTAVTFIQTEISRLKSHFKNKNEIKKPVFDRLFSVPFFLVVLLNLAGLTVGIANFPLGREYEWATSLFYIFWASCNLLLLSAMAAVAEESRHIRHYWRSQFSRPAMLKLPLGRALTCTTENFPGEALLLRLPTPMALEVGSDIGLSVFRDDREFTFPAQVSFSEGIRLRVRILDAAQENYLELAQATRSRGKDWPKWLPDREADRILPPWLSRPLNVIRIGIFDFYAGFRKSFQLNNLTALWEKKK